MKSVALEFLNIFKEYCNRSWPIALVAALAFLTADVMTKTEEYALLFSTYSAPTLLLSIVITVACAFVYLLVFVSLIMTVLTVIVRMVRP
jgi:hypothetical protein